MYSILVVLNSVNFRKSFKDVVKMYIPTLRVDEASDGKEALRRIQAHRPAIVFMDIHLPGMNGLRMTREIKAAYPEITVVILMSYDLPEYRETAYTYGADFLLPKDSITGAAIARLIESVQQPAKAAGF